MALITSSSLTLDDGRVATGPQLGVVTLKATSDYPVKVNGVEVKPGETKNVEVDLGNVGSGLSVPIFPAVSGKTGKADILFEIPSLQSKYD